MKDNRQTAEEKFQLLVTASTLVKDGIPGSVLTLGMNMSWPANPCEMTDEEILLFFREEVGVFLNSAAELTMMVLMAKAVKEALDKGLPSPTSDSIKERIVQAVENNRKAEASATKMVDGFMASIKKASA